MTAPPPPVPYARITTTGHIVHTLADGALHRTECDALVHIGGWHYGQTPAQAAAYTGARCAACAP